MMFLGPLFSLFLVLISTEALELGSRAITEDLFAISIIRRSWWKLWKRTFKLYLM